MTRARDSVMPLVRNGVDKAANRLSHVGYGVLPWVVHSWRRVHVEHNVPYRHPRRHAHLLDPPHHDLSGLERFSQSVERLRRELPHLVEEEHPKMRKFNFGEKFEYWAVVWGTAVMAITGFMLLNPIAAGLHMLVSTP